MNDSRKARRQRQRREAKERARQSQQKVLRATKLSRLLEPSWLLIEAIVALASLYVFFFQLPASFSVSSQTVLNQADPLSVQFTLTNDGFFNAHQIQPSCIIDSLTDINNVSFKEVMGTRPQTTVKVRAKDRFTIPCSFPQMNQLKSADMTLQLSYRSSFLFWHSNDAFRFVLTFSKNGDPFWLQQPIKSD